MAALALISILSLSFVFSTALPVITRHPNDEGNITVAVGSDVTLRCKASSTGNGTLNYQWRRVSGSLPSSTRGKNSRNLNFRNITISDSGQYYCEVDNGGDSVSSMRVQVTVKWRLTITHIPSDQQLSIVSGDEEVVLTCEVLNVGNDIFDGYWERVDDGPLPMKNNMSSLVEETSVVNLLHLTIAKARPTHSGKYRCIVYNEVGIDQSNNVTVTITIAPPNITKQPTDIIIQALEHATFTCEASGFKVKYEWKRHNSNSTIGNQSSLTIPEATSSDDGQYYCVAMTKGGYAFSNNVTLRVDGTINVNIRIRMHPEDVTVSEGGTAVLSIDARGRGSDSFTYEWKKVGSDSLPDIASGEDSAELTITSVTSSDGGLYYCIVMNQWGNMVKSNNATVNVLYITNNPKGTIAGVGRDVTLTCNASGADNLKYQWMRIGNMTIPSTAIGVNTGALIIPSITVDDSGQYKCVVSSGDVDVMSEYGNVSVLILSVIINNNSNGPVSVAEGSDVTLRCVVTGGGNLNYQWRRVSGSLPNSVLMSNGGRVLTIRNISVNDSGQYYCEVDNGGDSVSSMRVQVTTKTLPVITKHPNDNGNITVAEGRNVTLRCTATGDGILNYQWRRISGSLPNNSRVRGNGNLDLFNIAVSDSGQYYCEVSDGEDIVPSMRVQVTARRRPSVSGVSDNQQLSIIIGNEEVMLTCNVNGDDITGGYWERMRNGLLPVSNNMSSLSNDKRTLTITISRARPTHSGRYRCVVYSQWGVAQSSNVQVTITIAPPMITRQPTNQMITALQDVTFTCEAKGFDVKYEWKRHNGSVTGGRQSSLTISRVTPLDQDQYYCVAMTEGGYDFSNNVTLRVDDKLSIQVTLTSPTIGETGTAQFTAKASGVNMNKFTYQWRKRGNDSLPDKASGANGTVLTIPNAIKSDEGQYYCIVTNEWGRSVESSNIMLTVEAGLPLILSYPQNQFIKNKQKATFECFVNGSNSKLNVTWERNKRPYSSGNVENIVHSNGVRSILIINTATVRDDGKYRCRATNIDGKSGLSIEAELIIFPEITNNPNNVTVLIGQRSQLSCRALGTDIDYQWIKDDISIPDATSRTLRLTNITESDEGVYKCVASNKGDMVESNPATVTVYGPPIVERLPQQLHAELGKEFQITCTATNDQDAPMNLMLSWSTSNVVYIATTDEHDGLTVTSTLHISNVTHNHSGVYQCTASNGERQGNNVSVTSTLVVEEKSSPPISFSITHINSTSLELMWSSPRNPHGIINHYTVYYGNNDHNQSVKVVNNANFDGTYILTNLRPYTIYSVYVTAVRLIGGDSDRPLEGMKSKILTNRTLAGEPEISELEVDQSVPEIILNLNSSMASRGSTFDIDLPKISTANGPFSHFYIIVIINSSAINGQALTTQELLEHSMSNSMLLYIAAVVDASQYVQYAGGYRMKYILGAGDNTTDVYGHVFHNREVKSEYSFFYRVFSANSTLENEIYSNSEIKQIASPQQSTGASSSGNAAGPVIGVIVALLLIIAVIIIVILLLFLYKKKYSKTKDTGLSKVVPTDAGIQLNNKEMKDEDAKALPPLATTNPFPQETSFSPNSPLPMEVTASVGQPTTLFVELPYADDSEITWQKDGKSVSHSVLPDGSLYIANTKISDQGDYTVTATATDNTTSEMLKLIVIDPKMPTTLSDHKPVKVEDFPEHIALMQSKKSIQFEEDYEAVMMDVALSQHAAKLHVNASKNRYKNIVPYDHCRVVLTQQGQKPGSDYVNGSFVDGYKEPKAYIATQGPVSNTVDDFWRMIWEHNVTTIVMLTRLVEDSKIKCHQYWPESESAIYGNFKVTITKHEVIAKYCIRNFIIEKTSEHKSREVCQFHFTAWPDHGVPKYGTDILEFQKRIDKYHKRKDGKPMVVHCSAGVGRTGTFIAIDIEIQRINHESLVDVYNCVCRLRFWRNYMVQTVDQYTLIFTALLEHIACGDTSIAAPTKSVQDKVKELSAVDPHTKKTGFETQFETLTKNSPKEKEFAYSVASKNKSKNRNKKCLPPDTSRVHLSKVGDKSDYINACHIDGYRNCKEFLVGPGPMESTSADFWRMIWEKQSHAIVMLGQLKENGEEASFKYWPNKDDKCEYGNLTVQTTSEDPVDDNVTKRVMKITHKETSVTRTIIQLQYVEWPQNSAPSNSNSIIDLTEILERVQRKTGNGPITVHCSDGMGRSGTFCALVVSINRFKAEQMVDVFKTIITMRSQRPGLVANAEQYKFIHEAIINMLLRFATYSNFSNENTITDGVYENLPSSSM